MSQQSPPDFTVGFVGVCPSCGTNREYRVPKYERFMNNSDGIWSRCQCGKINWLQPE